MNNIFFSFSSNKKVAVMGISNSNIGVDVVDMTLDLRKLVNWACPYLKKTTLFRNKKLTIFLSQKIWSKIESTIKLKNRTLFDFLSKRKKNNFTKLYRKVFFKTLLLKQNICMVAKNRAFTINQVKYFNFCEFLNIDIYKE